MNISEWVVLIGGVAAILWVNWYFFLAEGRGEAPTRHEGGGPEAAGRNV